MYKETLKHFHSMASFALGILAISICLSFLHFIEWVADMFTHFQLQYLTGGLTLSLWFLAFKKFKRAALSFVCLLISGIQIFLAFTVISPTENTENSFKILQYNRRYTIPEHTQFIDYIKAESPDIVVIQEASKSHSEAAKTLLDVYPHQIHEPRLNAFGMVLLSRYPLKIENVKQFPKVYFDNIQFHVVFEPVDGHEVSLYALHPPPPLKNKARLQRNNEIRMTGEDIQGDEVQNIIMLGDWNLSPYSPVFKNLITQTGLKHEHTSWPIFQTWPSPFYFPFLQLPIDHILHKGELALVEKKRGPAMGSDHYPVIATYALPAHNE